MARQHTVDIKAGRVERDVLNGRDLAGSSIKISWVQHAIVKTAKLMLVGEFQEPGNRDFGAAGDVARGVIVRAELGRRVAIRATGLQIGGMVTGATHVVVLHLTVAVARLPASFDKQLDRYLRQLYPGIGFVHPSPDAQQRVGRDRIDAHDVGRNDACSEEEIVIEMPDKAAILDAKIQPGAKSKPRLGVVIVTADDAGRGFDTEAARNIEKV